VLAAARIPTAVPERTAARGRARLTQADRRARSRAALLEATARGISRVGYGHLVLEDVAAAAGYTRGALYHQFRDKDELVLAALEWVHDTWYAEVGSVFDEGLPPVEALVELARRHAVYCRRDIARTMVALRVEFAAREHPIGDAVRAQTRELLGHVQRLILAGRRDGSIAPGPPATVLARAVMSAVEGVVIALAGRIGDDEKLARRVALGLLNP
jgi:AcrR family transcriptional regulator